MTAASQSDFAIGEWILTRVAPSEPEDEDAGFYAWHAEPILAEKTRPILAHPKSLKCSRIDRNSLDEIVEKVRKWYECLASQMIRDE